MLPDALANAVRESCGDGLLLDARRGVGLVGDIARLHDTCQRLSNLGFSRCIDLTALHLAPVGQASPPAAGGTTEDGNGGVPDQADPNFQLYLLLRHPGHAHAALQLKWKYTQTDKSFHPSLSRIWPSAGLAERELWELLGIAFSGNDNLFPLLLDPQFAGWPLRRDYALPARASYADKLLRERYEQGLAATIPPGRAAVPGRHPAEDAGRDARATGDPGASP